MTLPLRTIALTAALSATLLVTGCAQHNYAGPPPPPPLYGGVPPLIQRADHDGFRMGVDDGARDAYNSRGYRPKTDRKFHDTPGYDPVLGPYQPYRDRFRQAYLRGYYQGYNRR
jgi:hypothetical protein